MERYQVRDYRGLSGSGRLGFKPSVGVRDKPSPASSRSPLSVWGFFIFSLLFVCLFLPRIYVPSHVLCAFFWALFFNYLLFFLKQTNMCDGHSVNSYFFPNLFLNFFAFIFCPTILLILFW